ncbi:MAG: hypothetical protein Q8O76_11720, partial [Chloroflexota bacterium]|nr:hypothetical protein [Chloroflexota bacterium]
ERCPYCAIIDNELDSRERLVAENASFVALEPYAARYPFETWIMPKRHDYTFVHLTKDEVVEWAAIIRETLLRLHLGLGDPPFNSYIHAAPCGQQMIAFRPHYHWHMEIIPRLTVAAGFELGATNYINITSPEEAARVLREVVLPPEGIMRVAEAVASATP